MNAVWAWAGWDPVLAPSTLLVAILCNVSCALVGSYLVLRKMSLLGDAISHSVLPGIAVAFLLVHSRSAWPMFLGALVMGGLTALMTQALTRWGGIPEDSSMGVVFTSLFSIGVIILVSAANEVHLDPGCVLYGLIEFTPLDTWRMGGIELPRAAWSLGAVLAVNAGVIGACFKELKIVSFDEAFARAVGVNASAVHYLLMGLVALTAVAAFEAVGSILVVAMLIVPGATAHLLTDRLPRFLWIACGVAVASAVFGYAAAVRWNTSVAGAMTVAAGALFAGAALLGPRHGWLGQAARRFGLRVKIAGEDVLSMMYRWEERGMVRPLTGPEVKAALKGGWISTAAFWWLERRGALAWSGPHVRLTAAGHQWASSLVRSHRLWEVYLAKVLGLPADHLHQPAEDMEHFISEDVQRALQENVGKVDQDPHGQKIPKEGTR